MTTHVLAINPATDGFGIHDPSAVLFVDGELTFGVEEGRLVRRKHAPGRFPTRAIRACTARTGIDLREIDRVLVPWDGRIGSTADRARGNAPGRGRDRDRDRAAIERRLAAIGEPVPSVELWNHHRSHAASAFAPSGFEEALVLTLDGRGARDSTVVWRGDDDGLERVRSYRAPNSLGYLYAAVADYLGFEPFGGEGKVMGLAPYGEADPGIDSRLRTVVETGVDYDVTGLVGDGVPTAVGRLERLLDRPRATIPGPFDAREKALAHTVQGLLEETVVSICETYCERLSLDRVCLAGGVALNCKANQRVAASDAVERAFVQPVAHDAGAPVGAALAAGAARTLPETVYWGPSSSTAAVERLLDRRGLAYTTPDDLSEAVAGRLADGALVGWFQGRMEMGPRALGNRSVLADPRTADARDRVNAFVKGRESWRPFAPSLPAEAAGKYLRSPAPAPHMIRTFDVRRDRREEIPAVLHPADATTRPQVVERAHNPRFHRLLAAFGEATGVPVLLNTSFNEAGEPLVATPAGGLDTFSRVGLDALAIEDCLVEK
jgi:carbamoyltransferase